MFAVLVELVEDMEEDFLGFLFIGQKLDVIDNEDVNHLVEVDKVIDGIILDGMDDLVREFFGGNEKHGFVGEFLYHFIPDGLGQVGLSESYVSEDNEWIERGGARALGDGDTSRASQPVAIPFNECFEGVLGVELGVDFDLLNPRDDEWVFNVFSGNAAGAV